MDSVGTTEWNGLVLKSAMPAGTKVVALTLSRYADHRSGRNARPGFPRLATDCNLSERTVQRAVGELAAGGWVVMVKRGSGGSGGGRAAVYALQVPKGHPTGTAGISDNQLPTEMSGIDGRHPPKLAEIPDISVGDTRQGCLPTFHDPAGPSTTTTPPQPSMELAEVVVGTLPADLKRQIVSVDLSPALTDLLAAGWSIDDLRAALPPGTWAGARGVGVVVKRLQWLAASKPATRPATSRRSQKLLAECTTCGAQSGAPRAERQVTGPDNRTGPCPDCRPNDARRTA